jgi:hypothetical protein
LRLGLDKAFSSQSLKSKIQNGINKKKE